MEDIPRMRLQHVVAIVHQEVVQQQIIINQLIRGQLRWRRGVRVRRILKRSRLHPERRANLASMISSRLSSEKIQNSNWKVRSCFWKPHTCTRSIWIDPSLKLADNLRHLDSDAKYSNMQYSWEVDIKTHSRVVREVCNAMCEEYADEVMTAPSLLKKGNYRQMVSIRSELLCHKSCTQGMLTLQIVSVIYF